MPIPLLWHKVTTCVPDVMELYSKPKKSWKKDTATTKDVLRALIVIDPSWTNYKSTLDSIIKSIAKHVILKYGTPLCLWNQDLKSKPNQETNPVVQGAMEKFLKLKKWLADLDGIISFAFLAKFAND